MQMVTLNGWSPTRNKVRPEKTRIRIYTSQYLEVYQANTLRDHQNNI